MKAIISDLNQISIIAHGVDETQARHKAAAVIAHRGGINAIEKWRYSGEPEYSGGILVDVDSVLADMLINKPQHNHKLKTVETSSGISLMINTTSPTMTKTISESGVISVFGRDYFYSATDCFHIRKPDSMCVSISSDGIYGDTISQCYIDKNITAETILFAAKRLVAEHESVIAKYAAEAELGLGYRDWDDD